MFARIQCSILRIAASIRGAARPALALLALAALLPNGAEVGAQDGGPAGLTLSTSAYYLPSPVFTWSCNGAVSDAGTFDFVGAHWGGIKSPAVGALQLRIVFTGAKGTIDMKLQLIATATSTPGIYAFDGPWQISGGTGAYAGLKGKGKAHIVGQVDQQSTSSTPELGTLTGQVSGS